MHSFNTSRTVTAGLVMLMSAPALAASFEYTDLGTLGGPESTGWGLNDQRQVVGWANVDNVANCQGPCRHAFVWDNGVMTNLGLLAGDEESVARAINNAGLVVGTSERDVIAGSGTFAAFSWQGGTMSALSDLGQAGSVFAHDVNENGMIAGHAQDPGSLRDSAVVWNAGAIEDVGRGETHSYSRGVGINDAGVVVGFAWNLFQPNDAILYDGLEWFTIGGTAGPVQNAEAKDVNDNGVAVGLMAFPSGAWHAAKWEGPSSYDLGTLPGLDYSELYDVNNGGEAVGRAYDSDNIVSRAVYFDGRDLFDLTDLVPGLDGVIFEAREINEAGDIVGTAVIDGGFRAVLLTPVPCSADIDGDGEVAFSDLVTLLTNWGPCVACASDIDDNDVVDFSDLVTLLSVWGPCP